uniref:Uncharacterized protein n=1 Tax=Caenorhabditis tropicalis TaxID=1561998 RepID=A0A1I7TQP1_9PELO
MHLERDEKKQKENKMIERKLKKVNGRGRRMRGLDESSANRDTSSSDANRKKEEAKGTIKISGVSFNYLFSFFPYYTLYMKQYFIFHTLVMNNRNAIHTNMEEKEKGEKLSIRRKKLFSKNKWNNLYVENGLMKKGLLSEECLTNR